MKFAITISIGLAVLLAGCVASDANGPDPFFTSGSREADQRADQRMAKSEQLSDSGSKGQPAVKKTLYERLGAEKGIQAIVDDFVNRAMADPRVNWERKDVKRGGVLGVGRRSAEWQANDQNLTKLKKHLAQFLALASGGPTQYDGGEMKQVHDGMKITNAEFDAAVGDLKATLDKLKIGTDDQKELLAIIESTRPQIVEQR